MAMGYGAGAPPDLETAFALGAALEGPLKSISMSGSVLQNVFIAPEHDEAESESAVRSCNDGSGGFTFGVEEDCKPSNLSGLPRGEPTITRIRHGSLVPSTKDENAAATKILVDLENRTQKFKSLGPQRNTLFLH